MTETDTTPAELPTIHQALIAVMREVTSLGKDGRNTSQGFSFRGIDATLNALGPVLRKHGVLPLPKVKQYDYTTIMVGAGDRGRPMGHVSVVVEYTFVGPRGDSLSAEAAGEAMDAGDKATPKAMSVAMRTALLQTFALPTDEPDPDSYSYDRAERAAQNAHQQQPAAAQRPNGQQQGTTPPASRPAAQRPAQGAAPAQVPPNAQEFVAHLRTLKADDDAAWRNAWKRSGELQLRAIEVPTNAGPMQLGKLIMDRMRAADTAARRASDQGISDPAGSRVDGVDTVAVSG